MVVVNESGLDLEMPDPASPSLYRTIGSRALLRACRLHSPHTSMEYSDEAGTFLTDGVGFVGFVGYGLEKEGMLFQGAMFGADGDTEACAVAYCRRFLQGRLGRRWRHCAI